jgi:hypothetical protein
MLQASLKTARRLRPKTLQVPPQLNTHYFKLQPEDLQTRVKPQDSRSQAFNISRRLKTRQAAQTSRRVKDSRFFKTLRSRLKAAQGLKLKTRFKKVQVAQDLKSQVPRRLKINAQGLSSFKFKTSRRANISRPQAFDTPRRFKTHQAA